MGWTINVRKIAPHLRSQVSYLTRAWWWFTDRKIIRNLLNRYFYKFHLINISNVDNDYKYGWIDSDFKMQLALIKILFDFVEKEKPFNGHINWEWNESHKEAKKEILEIYNWFKSERPKALENVDELFDEEFSIKLEEMLIRLIKIRRWMWT